MKNAYTHTNAAYATYCSHICSDKCSNVYTLHMLTGQF